MKKFLAFSFWFLILLHTSNSYSGTYVHKNIPASPVLTQDFFLPPGTYTIETKNLVALGAGPADTVLHVIDAATHVEIAYNDDIAPGTLSSKVTFTLFSMKTVTAVVYAYSTSRSGLCELHFNGAYWTAGYFSGNKISVTPSSSLQDYYLVMQSKNISPSKMFLFGCGSLSNTMTGIDHAMSGVGFGSRIFTRYNVCKILVASEEFDKNVTVYINDYLTDQDKDGLGAGLEAELGTCDSKSSPPSYCATTINTTDTDHDGLFDGWEILGVENYADPTKPFYLPAWGANPLYKDMFIEIDYMSDYITQSPHKDNPHPFMTQVDGVASNPDLQTKLEEVQNFFNKTGSASALKNPNGQDGIALHFDIGVEPSSSCTSCSTLFGNWGGSDIIDKNSLPATAGLSQEAMWDKHPTVARLPANQSITIVHNGVTGTVNGLGKFADNRKNIFFYMIATPYGNSFFDPTKGLEAMGIKFRFGHSPSTLAHESGHYLSLEHWGKNEWGRFNCKPNYPSFMNYAMSPSMGFSLANTNFINANNLLESVGTSLYCPSSGILGATDPQYLQNNPFQHTLHNYPCASVYPSVDWNNNSTEDTSSTRAAILWNNCGNLFGGSQNIILENNLSTVRPVIFRMNDRLYTLSAKTNTLNHVLNQKSGEIVKVSSGNGEYGSCQQNSDKTDETNCLSWSSYAEVKNGFGYTLPNLRAISAAWNRVNGWDNATSTFAYQVGTTIYSKSLTKVAGNHELILSLTSDTITTNAFDNDAASTAELAGVELTWIRVNPSLFGGHDVVLALFYLDPNRQVRWATKNNPSSSWVDQGNVLFEDPSNSSNTMSVVSSFTPSVTNVPFLDISTGKTCGLFSMDRSLTTNTAALELWCHDNASSDRRWKRVTTYVENSFRKPNLIFHSPRLQNGVRISLTQGNFIATFTLLHEGMHSTFSRTSSLIDSSSLFFGVVFPKSRARYYYGTSSNYRASIVFEDEETAAAKGIVFEQPSAAAQMAEDARIRFLPFADGTYNLQTKHNGSTYNGIRSGNDFEAMEKWLCQRLHRTEKWPCSPCQNNSDCPTGYSCMPDQTCNF